MVINLCWFFQNCHSPQDRTIVIMSEKVTILQQQQRQLQINQKKKPNLSGINA